MTNREEVSRITAQVKGKEEKEGGRDGTFNRITLAEKVGDKGVAWTCFSKTEAEKVKIGEWWEVDVSRPPGKEGQAPYRNIEAFVALVDPPAAPSSSPAAKSVAQGTELAVQARIAGVEDALSWYKHRDPGGVNSKIGFNELLVLADGFTKYIISGVVPHERIPEADKTRAQRAAEPRNGGRERPPRPSNAGRKAEEEGPREVGVAAQGGGGADAGRVPSEGPDNPPDDDDFPF